MVRLDRPPPQADFNGLSGKRVLSPQLPGSFKTSTNMKEQDYGCLEAAETRFIWEMRSCSRDRRSFPLSPADSGPAWSNGSEGGGEGTQAAQLEVNTHSPDEPEIPARDGPISARSSAFPWCILSSLGLCAAVVQTLKSARPGVRVARAIARSVGIAAQGVDRIDLPAVAAWPRALPAR